MFLPFEETKNYTHDQLVVLARQWLETRCAVVVSEITTTPGEEPDALGWQDSATILIECKTSRADFLADKNKPCRRNLDTGLGDYRYYLAPVGVIKDLSELPEDFGWLEINPLTGKISTRRKAKYQPAKNIDREIKLLLSVIRRIGQTEPEGVAIKCYTVQNKCRGAVQIETEVELVEHPEVAPPDNQDFSIKIETKVKEYFFCNGMAPNTGERCNKLLYQSDGEFFYDAGGSILNKGKGEQKIECARCGKVARWYRSPKYINSRR